MLEVMESSVGRSVFDEAQQWEGQVLANGNFRLRRYLGGSDHSAVFLTDIGVGQIRPPAIKLIVAQPVNADIQLDRWKTAAKLSHPHLLQIFDSGRCQLNGEELLFVVTENAEETLAEILRERALTLDEAGAMLKPILELLGHLHDTGYALGRVIPANIMALGEQVKLSRDGVCRAGSAALFEPSVYDPPEVALEGLTPASDVWGVGMTLAQALTRRVPIWDDPLRGEPTVPDGLPEPFADILRHCLLRDPRQRWAIADIKSGMKQSATVPVTEPPRDTKPQRKLGAPGKRDSRWLYLIPLTAMLATILLLSSLLHHRPSPQISEPSAPQPNSAASSSAPLQKRSKRSAVQLGNSASPVAGDGLAHRVVPSVPEKALRTIHGRVRVNVKVVVDGFGNVTRAEFISAGPSRYFANQALEAAREWKFIRGNDGRTRLLQFVFENTGVTVGERDLSHGA
jgi:serine/threonine protein kinase